MLLFSWFYRLVIAVRHTLYKTGMLSIHKLPVPVIIVGNIVVGGSGKTPLVIYLAQHLKEQGYKPGIISRGYKGKSTYWPRQVYKNSQPSLVGDEAVLIARRTDCPIAVAPNRYAAAMLLLNNHKIDIIICDDGLQHKALARDIEIITIDGKHRYGNGHCLPAGPLREPAKRLQQVDIIVCNGQPQAKEFKMEYRAHQLHSLQNANHTRVINQFSQQRAHAIAGIGQPKNFFSYLREQGLKIIEHAFPDHHQFTAQDIIFDDNLPVLMTEKDAVKCIDFATKKHWFLRLEIKLTKTFQHRLASLLRAYYTQS